VEREHGRTGKEKREKTRLRGFKKEGPKNREVKDKEKKKRRGRDSTFSRSYGEKKRGGKGHSGDRNNREKADKIEEKTALLNQGQKREH